MKKKVKSILEIIIVIALIIVPKVYASDEDGLFNIPQSATGNGEGFNQFLEGQATITSDDPNSPGETEQVDINISDSQDDTLVIGITEVGSYFPAVINIVLAAIITDTMPNLADGIEPTDYFTIGNLLTNKYELFDIDLFEKATVGRNTDFLNDIKDNVAIWYVALRNIAAVGCFITLLYVGIRMAIATNSEDSAKYKKMLVSWLIGIILLFIMQYIIIFMIRISNLFIELVSKAITDNSILSNVEISMITSLARETASASLWTKLLYFVFECVLIFYELKFFIMYLFRVLKIFVLTVISPLICLTYAIDSVGDGKAQAFNNWFKNLMFLIFIQPIHLIIYLVFMYSASAIVTAAPLIGVVFIIFLDNAEKIVKSALKISGGSVDKGLKDFKIGKGK